MKELYKIASAIMFFTRIPLNVNIPDWEKYINSCQRYFPLIGWLIGGACALIYYLCSLILPIDIAIIASMVTGVLLTGAFHEDGFGDICDGFGGGYTPEKILTIMKDSRMGAYGVIGIIFMLLTKYVALQHIELSIIIPTIIAGHTVSRFFSISILAFMNYARIDETSKSKPIAKQLAISDLIIATAIGLSVFVLFEDISFLLTLLLPAVGTIYLGNYFVRKIGGYTGDCLGAIQQLSEVLFYISIIIVQSKIIHDIPISNLFD